MVNEHNPLKTKSPQDIMPSREEQNKANILTYSLSKN